MHSRWFLLALSICVVSCSSHARQPEASSTPTASELATSTATTTIAPSKSAHASPTATSYATNQSAPAIIGTIHQAWISSALDGLVYAKPLFNQTSVIVATENDSVYSLSASTGAVQWRRNLGSPVPQSSLPCGNIDPMGITGTPVIDTGTNTLYVLAFLSSGPHHELYALDASSGSIRWHHTVEAPNLDPTVEGTRGALGLANGLVYIPFGGLYGDCGQYKGAVVAYPESGSGTSYSYTVPTQREGGIWNPQGAVTDANGDVWVSTGNSASTSSFDYGNAIIHLSAHLKKLDYFAPSDWSNLNANDTDLGSVGPALVSDNRVIAAGKEGIAYLLNRNHLGGVGGEIRSANICSRAFGTISWSGTTAFVACEDSLVALSFASDQLNVRWSSNGGHGPSIVTGPLVWSLSSGGTLTAFNASSGSVRYHVSVQSPVSRFISPATDSNIVVIADRNHINAYALR
ncbi:MAG: outer membrane protein assembly factor BamB family protein [Actinomycetota bacterium]